MNSQSVRHDYWRSGTHRELSTGEWRDRPKKRRGDGCNGGS